MGIFRDYTFITKRLRTYESYFYVKCLTMFSLIITIISIALVVGVTGATMYYLSGTGDSEAILAAAELLTQSEQIAAAIDMRAFQEKGELAGLDALVTGKYLMQVPLPPEYAFVSGESSVLDWQVPQANPRPVVLVSNKIKASVCSAFNNKMLNDASIPAKANPALRIQCFGAAEPYSVVINPSMNPDQLEAVLPADTGTTTPEPDAQLPVPQTVALESANLCFKQGVYGSFDFKTVFSASQETNPTVADVVWSASGTLPAGMSFDTATGVLSGTPTETTSGGDYTVTASYKNAEGQQVYKLLVKGSELEALSISAGESHTCAVTVTYGVKCWGLNSDGRLGDGTTTSRTVPTDVVGLAEDVVMVGAGGYFTCATLKSGAVKCWGKNDLGQLGNGTTVNSLSPVTVVDLPDITALSVGHSHACVITKIGGAKCWGYNATRQLGDGTTTDKLSPTDVQNLPESITAISSGFKHTCALTISGGALCWGFNSEGQLGWGSYATAYSTPGYVTGLETGVSSINTGVYANNTCAITVSGTAKCWGANGFGQLGNGTTTRSKTPVTVSLPANVLEIGPGMSHTCSRLVSGDIYCWGRNLNGTLGDGTTTNRLTPVKVQSLAQNVAKLHVAGSHTCVLLTSGTVNCWGYNIGGRLGDGTQTSSTTPVTGIDISSPQTCTDITLTPSTDSNGNPTVSGTISLTPATLPEFKVGSPASYNFAALYKDSLNASPNMADVTWSGVGTLPAGLTLDTATGVLSGTPTEKGVVNYTVKATYKGSKSGQQTYQVVVQDSSSLLKSIEASFGTHTCGFTLDNMVKCWGNNTYGQLGNNTTTNSKTPVLVQGLGAEITAISVGAYHSCAITKTGGLKCWGDNSAGQLGTGDKISSSTPVAVQGLGMGVTSVSAGFYHTCAVLTDGTARCWGSNQQGMLGNGSTVDSLVPSAIANLSSVKSVSSGAYHSCAVTQLGAVYCWGYNSLGELGNGTTQISTVPLAVVGFETSGAQEVRTASQKSCALTTSGGVKCWGGFKFSYPAIFDESTRTYVDNIVTYPTTPVDVPDATSGIKSITNGGAHMFAHTTANTVLCWGQTTGGQCGFGGVQVGFPAMNPKSVFPALLNGKVQDISGGNIFGCALLDDGKPYCWGQGIDKYRTWDEKAYILGPNMLPLDQPLYLGGTNN